MTGISMLCGESSLRRSNNELWEEKRILTSRISDIEDEYYKVKNEYISCDIVWYEGIKVLIPSTHLGISKINKSMVRGMIGAIIDFIVIEIDTVSNIAIASR